METSDANYKKIINSPLKLLQVSEFLKCLVPNLFEFATSILNLEIK
jgi:hypothetical protein